MDRERIYAVTFNSYTNGLRNTVSDGNTDIVKTEYIHLSKDVPFLIRESELLYYSKFGQGYSVIRCVGELPDKKCDKKIGAATPTKINTNQFDENNSTATKVDNFTRFCRDCPSGTSDNTSLSSHPIRCGITGKCHTINDTCDIENTTITVKC